MGGRAEGVRLGWCGSGVGQLGGPPGGAAEAGRARPVAGCTSPSKLYLWATRKRCRFDLSYPRFASLL